MAEAEMMLSADTLPLVMQSSKSYTDSEIAKLEQRISERIQNAETRITTLIDARDQAHDRDMHQIGDKIDGLTQVINGWQIKAETLTGQGELMRDIQVQQAGQAEALLTLQSDLYGNPARGRETVFSLMDKMATSILNLTNKVETSSEWIAAETQRQAEARQRWANRQAAALGLVKMIPAQAWIGLMAGAGAAALIVLKSLGG